MFKFKFQKENKGENFQGLDLLTKLLTPKAKEKTTGPLIEELNANEENGSDDEDGEEEEDGDMWYLEQEVCKDDELKITDIKYGFAQTKSNVFSKLSVSIFGYTILIRGVALLLLCH